MVGVAVKVTFWPEQIVVPEPDAMLTEGVTALLTVIVTPVDVTDTGLAHCAFDVSCSVIISPLANAPDE